MSRYFYYLCIIFGTIFSCKRPVSPAQKDNNLTQYVNPFIGTGGHGHTYPGATMPFGMMQLSPDTRLDGWDGCSGYHYSDEFIYGFSHTHLSGTGVSDYGDVLLMPTRSVIFSNGPDGSPGYRAKFSHDHETAEPGYYKVHLDSTDIDVELTVSYRSGLHKYQFSSAENQILILDLNHRDQLLAANIQQVSNTKIIGKRHSKAWAEKQMLFYAIELSHPIKKSAFQFDEILKTNTKAAYELDNPDNEPVVVKIGISAVDVEGALKNLKSELADKSFETVKKEAQNIWEQQLERVVVEHKNQEIKTIFYTSLYHSMLAPNLYQDVDGRYRGMDLNIHQTNDFQYYTVFSLWDTYRAAHPLYTIIEQDRTRDFINTFLAKFDEGGIMPIWDLSGNYTGCMIGYHAVPVIADAYLKGIKNFDAHHALHAMKHSAEQDHLGLKYYKKNSFIPVEMERESVSKTLEYAYDDWTIAQMAKAMGQDGDYKTYSQRAQSYKNVFDPQSGFMRGRFRNQWFAPFDPYEVNFNYTEANAWQYSFYVPQDVSGLMELLGGKQAFEYKLDALFTAKTVTSGRDQADITGLIGQYAHGNEPSHHMAYLYNFVNKPHKTQQRVHEIISQLYANTPDGISGNEDCGQMSAWYVLSALGFYPVTPGSNQYIIGTPSLDKATINLENGHQFTVVAHQLTDEHFYIQNIKLNGQDLNRSFLWHDEIMKGGRLEFFMTDKPSDFGTQSGTEPITEINEFPITPAPFIAKGDVAFKGETHVELASVCGDCTIYYQLEEGNFEVYQEPIIIQKDTRLSFYTEDKAQQKSAVLTTDFHKIDPNISIALETEYANQYNAGGNQALIDGILGTTDFRTGTWQGYYNVDVVATVDLGSARPVNLVTMRFLEDQRSWIFLPTKVTCLGSLDGVNFNEIETWALDSDITRQEVSIKTINFKQPSKPYRYIKLMAKTLGDLPTWHLGHKHQGKSWLFIDEILIK